MKQILFDIDSTLLRDGGASGKAYAQAFKELYNLVPVAVEKYGKTDPDITREIALATLGRLLTDVEEAQLYDRYTTLIPGYLESTTTFTVLPGVRVLCRALHCNPSYILGIQTGNLETSALAKLRRAALDCFFSYGGYGSDAADRITLVQKAIERGNLIAGQESSKSDVIVIGDSPLDIIAGKSNGTRTIGVTTGKNSAAELFEAGADAVVADCTDRTGIIAIIVAWERNGHTL